MKEAKDLVQQRFDDIAGRILDEQKSLCGAMVRAYRNGVEGEKLQTVWDALEKLVQDAKATYNAAIAQPAPRVSLTPRIQL